MTIFENVLLSLIFRKCHQLNWWMFDSVDDLNEYWSLNSHRIDPKCRFYSISLNERELNVLGFDALSENPYIDEDSVIISRHNLEEYYEEMYFGE